MIAPPTTPAMNALDAFIWLTFFSTSQMRGNHYAASSLGPEVYITWLEPAHQRSR